VKIDTGSKNRREVTFLAANISSGILEYLDRCAPSYFLMYDVEGEKLQNALEEIVRKSARKFVEEWHAE